MHHYASVLTLKLLLCEYISKQLLTHKAILIPLTAYELHLQIPDRPLLNLGFISIPIQDDLPRFNYVVIVITMVLRYNNHSIILIFCIL